MKTFLAIFWTIIGLAVFFAFYSYRSVETSSLKRITTKYELVTKTPLTENSHEFKKLIEYRVACFGADGSLAKEKLPCMETYVLTLLRMCEKDATALPNKSGFVRCVRECPIMFNICMGEKQADEPCVKVEEQCIEHCLDKEWRGPRFVQKDQGWSRVGRSMALDNF
jgi:hypothetical protein